MSSLVVSNVDSTCAKAKAKAPIRKRPTRARNRLALAHEKLARRFAALYAPKCQMEFEDALQEATIGLLKAAAHHDRARGKFSTFAWRCMQSALDEALRHRGPSMIRTPRGSGEVPPLVVSLSTPLDGSEDDEALTLGDVLPSNSLDPEQLLLAREAEGEWRWRQ